MKFRLLPRRRSVGTARMTVKAHVPLALKLVGVVATIAVSIGVGIGLGRAGPVREWFGDDRGLAVTRLADENQALRDERDRLREASGTTDSRRVMEDATIRELGDQIARLEVDNARLKEDVAFFESATADRTPGAKDVGGGIAIRRFQVRQDPGARLARYRILLTQDSRANRDFSGDLQLALTVSQGGKAVSIVLPQGRDGDAAAYAIVFRSYKRIDGVFAIPPDAVLKSVQARVLDHGAVRAQQTFTLP